jgi:hypothetical protein
MIDVHNIEILLGRALLHSECTVERIEIRKEKIEIFLAKPISTPLKGRQPDL